MTPIQKTPARVGRPRYSKKVLGKKHEQRRADGDRLRSALEFLKLSQTAAAKRADLKQGNLSSIISGERDLDRKTLRRLYEIGIPCDYLLGLTDKLVLRGETQTAAELADELVAAVWNIIRQQEEIPLLSPTRDRVLRVRPQALPEMPRLLDGSRFTPWLAKQARSELKALLEHKARSVALSKAVGAAGGNTAAIQRLVSIAERFEPATELLDSFYAMRLNVTEESDGTVSVRYDTGRLMPEDRYLAARQRTTSHR